MKKIISFAIYAIVLGLGAEGTFASPYYGLDSGQAVLSFHHRVKFESRRTPSASKARQEIEDQVQHLFGTMAVAPLQAVPKTDHTLTQIQVQKISGTTYEASYDYRGHIVIQHGRDGDYPLTMPVFPDKVYQASLVRRPGGGRGRDAHRYPCITDEEDWQEEDFWYFWAPTQTGCPLKKDIDYEVITGQVERIPNTTTTYPEYQRLVDENGEIRIDMLFGMDDPSNLHDPWETEDAVAEGLLQVYDTLIENGFQQREWTPQEIRRVSGRTSRNPPYVLELTKQERKAKIVVRIFFGASAIEEDSQDFHHFLRDALQNASVLIYSGHSGLGNYVSIPNIERERGFRLQPNVNRYQIYFFDSCSSHPYYASMYMDRKKTANDPMGTKNLDFLSTGLATYFSIPYDTTGQLPRAIQRWASGEKTMSYQEIIYETDSENLLGINGDEDNPTRP